MNRPNIAWNGVELPASYGAVESVFSLQKQTEAMSKLYMNEKLKRELALTEETQRKLIERETQNSGLTQCLLLYLQILALYLVLTFVFLSVASSYPIVPFIEDNHLVSPKSVWPVIQVVCLMVLVFQSLQNMFFLKVNSVTEIGLAPVLLAIGGTMISWLSGVTVTFLSVSLASTLTGGDSDLYSPLQVLWICASALGAILGQMILRLDVFSFENKIMILRKMEWHSLLVVFYLLLISTLSSLLSLCEVPIGMDSTILLVFTCAVAAIIFINFFSTSSNPDMALLELGMDGPCIPLDRENRQHVHAWTYLFPCTVSAWASGGIISSHACQTTVSTVWLSVYLTTLCLPIIPFSHRGGEAKQTLWSLFIMVCGIIVSSVVFSPLFAASQDLLGDRCIKQ
ncbi:hypothetical protein PROFUN_13311 [Planoprotostelium fungivorum]|uniref:Transmembrane protein n=1 Tax=Planoprotostelium fungivorum TaxID=1890364 RepID=A0A2P6N469_9EUKA|nr:hypothetical protein PROFUN_13311 [Planoprotostelium fungivorum]